MFDISKPTEGAVYWTDHVGNEADGNSGFWWDRDGVRYVLLHGTWPFGLKDMDMKANLDVWPRRYGGSAGHGGYIHYAIVAMQYLTEVSSIIERGMPIVLVGHSLGGAVAQFLGMRLRWAGYDVRNVVTYGAPTDWGRGALVREFRAMFPKAVNVVVGWDLTRWLWVLTFWLGYGGAARTRVVSGKGLSPVEGHLPWKIVDRIPAPWEV